MEPQQQLLSDVTCKELPDHLIYSILLNLPLKSLLHCCCLSKKWQKTILSRSFYLDRNMLQSANSVASPAVDNVLCWFRFVKRKLCQLALIHRMWGDKLDPQVSFTAKVPFGFKLSEHEDDDFFYVSKLSCDGLLCVIYKSNVSASMNRIVIWNPCTQKFRCVAWPEAFKDDCYGDSIFVGFGFDPSVDDYKIVIMKSSTTSTSKWVIQVTCLKSNNESSWRDVQLSKSSSSSLPHNLVHTRGDLRPVTVKGDIYWKSKLRCDHSRHILKFSLESETLTIIQLPLDVSEKLRSQIPHPELEECCYSWRQRRIQLGHKSNKFLYLYHYNAYPEYKQGYPGLDAWLYSEDEKCFKKVLSISENIIGSIGLIRPLGYTARGDFIITCFGYNELAAFNSQQGKLEILNTNDYLVYPEYKRTIPLGYALLDMEGLIVP